MPANLYGTAAPNPLPVVGNTNGGVNVGIPPGVETNFLALPFPPATSPGWYYPAIWGQVVFTTTATPPTFVNWGARIGAGADFSVQSSPVGILTATTTLLDSLFLYGVSTFISNPFTSIVINVSASVGVNGMTVIGVGTWLWGGWLRAPDQ